MQFKLMTLIIGIVVMSPVSAHTGAIQLTQGTEIYDVGYFQLGFNALDVDELNAKLIAIDMPEMPSSALTIGGAGYRMIDRIIIGGEGHGFFAGGESIGSRQSYIFGGYGMFNFGYAVLSQQGLNIFPVLGLGAIGAAAMVQNDSYIGEHDEVEVASGGALVNIGLGIDYLIALGPEQYGGISFGARIGYNFGLFTEDIKLSGPEGLPTTPIGFNGVYLKINIGDVRIPYFARKATEPKPKMAPLPELELNED